MMNPLINYLQGSSETIISSEELLSDHDLDDQEEDHDDDDDDDVKRSYECTFCRRGFTNAQALGGHMNIHRKDKAKAKKLVTPNNNNSPSSPNNNNSHQSMASSNCYTIFQPSSAPNNYYPSSPHAAYAFQYEFLSTTRYHHHHNHNHQSLGANQDFVGPNLSLQIGPSDHVRRGIHQKDDSDVVDLELRLGHHPCSNY